MMKKFMPCHVCECKRFILSVDGVPQWNEASIQSNDTSSNCSAVTYVHEDETAVPTGDLLLVVSDESDSDVTSRVDKKNESCCPCPTTTAVVQCCGEVARLTGRGPVILPADLNNFNQCSSSNNNKGTSPTLSSEEDHSMPSTPAKSSGVMTSETTSKPKNAAQAVKNMCKKFTWKKMSH